MSKAMEVYRQWLAEDVFDAETKEELRAIAENPKEIEERFYKELEFGTAGLRGILGAGTNRMNRYTVGKVTQGLCDFLLANEPEAGVKGIAIAFDPRHRSLEFAQECALIIAANGIKVYLFDDIRPTPELSFTIRHLGCVSGIVITASHNPSIYNGYKVYGKDGAQMAVVDSDRVVEYTAKLSGYDAIKRIPREEAERSGLLVAISADIDEKYLEKVHGLSLRLHEIPDAIRDIRIVYTPLHGAGYLMVPQVLRENGFENVLVVPEQSVPDPDFSTVVSPNPENRSAFDLAIELAKKEDVDIIIGTDPDCDRLGVVFRDFSGEYVVLSGNQIGCLLMEYILGAGRDTGTAQTNDFVVKSIVTTKLADQIAQHYGVAIYETFTGFKNICEKVKELDEFGDQHFVYGFEESNGYVAGSFVRDKDAVIASMLTAEMAAWYKSKGQTLADAWKHIEETYGYTIDEVISYTLEGIEGLTRIAEAMKTLRSERPDAFGSFTVQTLHDYETQEIFEAGRGVIGSTQMDKSNVLSYTMTDGSRYVIRPSGTEPKIKLYFCISAPTKPEAESLLARFREEVTGIIEAHLKA